MTLPIRLLCVATLMAAAYCDCKVLADTPPISQEIRSQNSDGDGSIVISGEQKAWHKITLTLDGPYANELDNQPNPFVDYRMDVTFSNGDSRYVVPGYFAADGDAGNSSASAGTKWRAHLSPDKTGEWEFVISFRAGKDVAVSDDRNAGDAVKAFDGLKGSFIVSETDKTGRDFRGKGRLQYVGKHHLRHMGNGEYFLKCGADAPENFLAYNGFDGDFQSDGHKDNLVKSWQPHVKDWKTGDPSWQDGKGKGIVGAINYLSDQGMNAFSFLTMNVIGDDRNVFPYVSYDDHEHIDCSRMDQWEMLFEHADKLGMYLHFKTMEAENTRLLNDGDLGRERKLYYRELIARFAHHLALNWNLGEEVGYKVKISSEQKKSWAEYFATHDPYRHHMVIHNGNNHFDMMGPPESGGSHLTGFSLQTGKPDFRNVHGSTLNYLRRSVKAGKPWVVACDEPGDASHSLLPDAEDAQHDDARKNALWGNLMAGGAGVEWYFGYKHPHSDLTCEDYRSRHNMWQQGRHALAFFRDNAVPFWNMSNRNELVDASNAYCLAEDNKLFVVFFKSATQTELDLTDANGTFEILWFNPRDGGDLTSGSTKIIAAGKKQTLGNPPADPEKDWAVLLRPTT